jgi:small subunit ribosomal protein S16
MFRVIVQEAHRTPTSGKVIAYLGSYDPHTKTATLEKEKASLFLNNGAQPSDRVALLLQKEGVKLPKWVTVPAAKQGAIRNQDKLRRNQTEAPVEEAAAEKEPATEAPEATEETPATEEKTEA